MREYHVRLSLERLRVRLPPATHHTTFEHNSLQLAATSFSRGIRVNVCTNTRQLDRVEARTVDDVQKALTLLADSGQIIIECGRCGLKIQLCEWAEAVACDADPGYRWSTSQK